MLSFFDYFFYRASVFYDTGKDNGPAIAGLFILSLMQFFNLLSIECLIEIIRLKKFEIPKVAVVLVIILLSVINGIRYNKLSYDLLKKRWDNESEKQKKKRGVFVLLYLLLSTVIAFSLAIYIGNQLW